MSAESFCATFSCWSIGRALRLLNQIPGVSLERDAIDRRPSISLETLATAGAIANLCTALEWVVEQATRAA
jgi:hypothetical protein